MHFICRSFIGKADSQNWSQYWENEPDDFQLKASRGHLFGLIALTTDKNGDIKNIGHDLIFEINQNYFSIDDDNLDILSSLKKTLESVAKNPLYKDYHLEIVLLVVLKNKSFVVSLGDNNVSLSRQSTITSLITKDSQTNQSIKFISGPIESGDRFFLSNSNFFNKVTWPKIKSILSDSKIQNIEETFLSSLYSFDDQSNLSALLIEIKEDNLSSPPISETEENTQTPSEPSEQVDFYQPSETTTPISQKNPSVFVGQHPSQETSKRKKIQIITAIVLLIALFVSCFFGYKKNKRIKTEEKYQQLKTELTQQLNEASAVKSLSLETAQSRAKEAESIIKELILLEIHSDEVNQFKSQIDILLSQTGLNQNFTPDFFYDTANIVSDPKYSHLFINQDDIYLFDSTSGRIDKLGIKDRPNNLIAKTNQGKSATKIIGNQDDIYFLFDDNLSKLNSDDDLDKEIDFSDSDPIPNPTDVQIWNGSIYLLDSQQHTIWKFSPSANGFSQAQNWLKNDKELELGPVSLDIDGEIWVLYQNGQIENYISGVKDNFALKGDQQFNRANNLTVSLEDDAFISFLDGESLIFVYKKNGDFFAKYNLGDLKVSDLSLHKNILYILASDQKVYQIKL